MFRQRVKKNYPEGTFIPMPPRVAAIIQLCLAFTIILWHLATPFSTDFFSVKSNLILYQDVMGTAPREGLSQEKKERLNRNEQYFAALPEEQREVILNGMKKTLQALQQSFSQKLRQSLSILAFKISSFEQAWLLFSIVLAIMLLKRVEGARQAIWLLPILTMCYAVDNRWYGHSPTQPPDAKLFPSEKILIEQYYRKPLNDNIFKQQEQLQEAWKLYLVEAWTSPVHTDQDFEQQAAQGEFAFNSARLILLASNSNQTFSYQKEPFSLLSIYIFWNVLFASFAQFTTLCNSVGQKKAILV